MATLLQLQSAGRVFKLEPAFMYDEEEDREIYALPALRDWIEKTLPELGSTWNLEQTPEEQLDAFVVNYCSGAALTYEQDFKPLVHLGEGVWELKVADIRIFGWFYIRDCFIGAYADTAQRVKDHDLYRGYCGQVVRCRNAFDLDEPRFVKGTSPHDVVSNFDFPEPSRGNTFH